LSPAEFRPLTRTLAFRSSLVLALLLAIQPNAARAEGDWEITPESQQALARGLQWLAKNQGPEGNWGCNELGVVSVGALAFLADGHLPGRGRYGENVERALDYVLRNERPPGLLNITEHQHDMYNHGLSTFVLGQAYGMTGDQRIGPVLDRALKMIADTQCEDGGWQYNALRGPQGHDLSLAVMQAKALRSAVDSGLQVSPQVIDIAIRSVREHYCPDGCPFEADEATQKKHPGQFTYDRNGGHNRTLAMAAAGVVCLQEFAQYDDWRIEKSLAVMTEAIKKIEGQNQGKKTHRETAPFDAYTLYYVAQALYQVGGKNWEEYYPALRDGLVYSQISTPNDPKTDGMWRGHGHLGGTPGDLYMTAVACFVLAIPNRYLPILQEGHIEGLQKQFQQKK
jgi:hypothetical protein